MTAKFCAMSYCALGIILSASAANFFVSPTGAPTGDGSLSRPWDLQTALYHPAAVKPGDTIWLRGGVHRQANRPTRFCSSLAGTADAPITVRQYPGERATIDGSLNPYDGGWVNFWGFEIMNSYPSRYTSETGSAPTTWQVNYDGKIVDLCVSGVDLRAPNVKLINLIVHDSIGGGIGVSTVASNPEIYGVLSYYNGWQGCDRGHGHGIYAQSSDPNVANVRESLFFANYALGVQVTGTGPDVDNFVFEGNVVFANGALARRRQANFLLGSYASPAQNPVLIGNFTYDTRDTDADFGIGYVGGALNPIVASNYFQTSVMFSPSNQNLVLSGNTFLSQTINLVPSNYPDNAYVTSRPQTNLVVVRPNRYEAGRAHIIVYNWANSNSVTVDVSGVLDVGMLFEVRNAQDYFGDPVLCGVYVGEPLVLPLTGMQVAAPVGTNAPPSTAPEFNVFVLMLRYRECGETLRAPTLPAGSAPSPEAATPATLGLWTGSEAEAPRESVDPLGLAFESGPAAPTAPAESPPATFPPLVFQPDGAVLLRIQVVEPGVYEVQTSTNLTAWISLAFVPMECENGILFFFDDDAPDYPARFYRVLWAAAIERSFRQGP